MATPVTLTKLNLMLRNQPKAAENLLHEVVTDKPSDDVAKLIKALEAIIGKDAVVKVSETGDMVKLSVNADAFHSHGEAFDLNHMQEWINGNGFVLISRLEDVEPRCVLVYLGRVTTELKEDAEQAYAKALSFAKDCATKHLKSGMRIPDALSKASSEATKAHGVHVGHDEVHNALERDGTIKKV